MTNLTDINAEIGVVGAGAMGQGIAQIAAVAGHKVYLFDLNAEAAANAVKKIGSVFARLVEKGRMTQTQADETLDRLIPAKSEEDLADCKMVVEAIIERLDAKQALFTRLEQIVASDSILATNTSSLSVTEIAAQCERPERVAGFHFFNPVPLMKIVEVISGTLTDPKVTVELTELAKQMGHTPIAAVDTPGFIVNHCGRGFGTEAMRLLQDGVADFSTIDDILRRQCGFRMGPFELMDLTGLDVSHPVMESIYDQFYQEPRFRPSYLLRQRYAGGLLGKKNGRGFYPYGSNGIERPEPKTWPKVAAKPVWIAAAISDWTTDLKALVTDAGLVLETSDAPSSDALCLVAPLGQDVTTYALQRGIDPERTVGIDLLFGLENHRTLMVSPATNPEFQGAAAFLAQTGGIPVSVISDSHGFVAQRFLAGIINIACEMAQQGIASPEDIDLGAKLGLGYPKGPMAWGDELGADRVLRVLEALYLGTGDARYRPSLWLSRRARLGLSLFAPDKAA